MVARCGVPLDPSLPPYEIPATTDDGVGFTLFTLGALTLLIRLYTRARLVRNVGLDDWLAIVAMLVIATLVGANHITRHNLYAINLAHHERPEMVLMDSADKPAYLHDLAATGTRANVIVYSAFYMGLAFVKCSIVAFYGRITQTRRQQFLLWALGIVILGFSFSVWVANLLAFDPVRAQWDFVPEARLRVDPLVLGNIFPAFQILFDIILLAIPVPVIWKLHLSAREKSGLVVLYLLSCASLIATVLRFGLLTPCDKLAQTTLDQRAIASVNSILTHIEIQTAFICANLPALRSFIMHLSSSRREEGLKAPSGDSPAKASFFSDGSSKGRKAWIWLSNSGKIATSTESPNMGSMYRKGYNHRHESKKNNATAITTMEVSAGSNTSLNGGGGGLATDKVRLGDVRVKVGGRNVRLSDLEFVSMDTDLEKCEGRPDDGPHFI